jgi:hypothetical protein
MNPLKNKKQFYIKTKIKAIILGKKRNLLLDSFFCIVVYIILLLNIIANGIFKELSKALCLFKSRYDEHSPISFIY